MRHDRTCDERGLTLTELTIVAVLALLVSAAIVTFYINSQASWTDASSKSITQREATALVSHMANEAHRSSQAVVTLVDGANCRLEFFDAGQGVARYAFWWDPADSLVHEGSGAQSTASGTSTVERFALTPCTSCDSLVELTSLTMRSADGRRITMSTTMAMYNRASP